MTSPQDRLALVTGTSAGIGAALAKQLLARGWRVVGVARRLAAIDHPQYTHLSVDLAHVTHAIAAIERVVVPLVADSRWRRIGLVNNAALGGMLGPLENIAPDALLTLYAVNVAAPVRLMGLAVERSHPDAAQRCIRFQGSPPTAAARPRCGWPG